VTEDLLEQTVLGRRLGHGSGRRLREQAGISCRELADAIGVDVAQLSRWERGLAQPRPARAARWIAALETLRRGMDQPIPVIDERSGSLLSDAVMPPALTDGITSNPKVPQPRVTSIVAPLALGGSHAENTPSAAEI
jgi:transcriptional regulator with XRE-family HTH domain